MGKKLAKITSEQASSMLMVDSNTCPFCNTTDITAQFEPEGIYNKVRCNKCEAAWNEEFEITHISITNLPDNY